MNFNSRFFYATKRALALSLCGSFFLECFTYLNVDVYTFSCKIFLCRMAILFSLQAIGFAFRPTSSIWTTRFDLNNVKQKWLCITIVIASCIILSLFTQVSKQGAWLDAGDQYDESIQHVQNGNQYNYLADALLNGRVDLDLPISGILLEMDNPYDTAERTRLNAEQHDSIYWDYAYYEGHYYCYFGILPCLMTFLPFKLLTGSDLRTDYAVIIFVCLTIISAFYLVRQLASTLFRGLSLGKFLLGYFCLLALSGIAEQAFLPRIYPIPILAGLFLCFCGIAAWLIAKHKLVDKGILYKRWLILGSVCIALTIACRPQYLLVAFLAFPLFWDEIRQHLFFSLRGSLNTLAVIIPFFIIATPICYYNYIRFGSFVDFGASYNLTGADMTAYVFDPLTIAVRLAQYLFMPLTLNPTFPYVYAANEVPTIPLLWTNEPFYGGFFILSPVSFIIFLMVSRKYRVPIIRSRCMALSLASLTIAMSILVVVSYVSGVTMRYFSDFGWLISITCILVFWSQPDKEGNKILGPAFSFLLLCGIGLYGLTFFGTARFGALCITAPRLFETIKSLIAFL